MSSLTAKRDLRPRGEGEGKMATDLISQFLQFSNDKRKEFLQPEEFLFFLDAFFGMTVDNPVSILTVLRHNKFLKLVHSYCATTYGEKNFSWDLISDIIGSHLDNIWVPKVQEFLDFGESIFQERISLPSTSDWENIMNVSCRPYDSMRLLFFPGVEDYWNEPGRNCSETAKGSLVRAHESLYLLNEEASASVGEYDYPCRRPGFLELFSDEAYVQVFRNLQKSRHLSCPSWHSFYELERTVSAKITLLLQHVVAWVEPRFAVTTTASKALDATQWDTKIVTYVFKQSTLSEGAIRPWQGELTDSEYEKRSGALIKDIWNEVATSECWNKDETLLKQVRTIPAVFRLTDKTEVEGYMHRFSYESWSRLVKIVIKHAGPCLAGPMAQFNIVIDNEDQGRPQSPRYERYTEDVSNQNNLANQVKETLNKKVSRDDLEKRLKIPELIRHYCELKTTMLKTLRFYTSGDSSMGGQQINVIKTSELYDTAKESLLKVACMLHDKGIEVDVDNFYEDLSKLGGLSSHDREDRSPEMGFLSALPLHGSLLQDTDIMNPSSNSSRLGSKRRHTTEATAPTREKRQKTGHVQVKEESALNIEDVKIHPVV